MAKKSSVTERQMKDCLGRILRQGSERYPYARTCASDLFSMTPDDYRLDGWLECSSYAVPETLQHVKNTLESNMKKCNVEDVFGVTFGQGYRTAIADVMNLLDNMLNALKKNDQCRME